MNTGATAVTDPMIDIENGEGALIPMLRALLAEYDGPSPDQGIIIDLVRRVHRATAFAVERSGITYPIHPFTCAWCRDAGIRDERSEWPTRKEFLDHMAGMHPGLPAEPPIGPRP